MWFPTSSDTNRPVQAQKRARSLKFRIKVEEELYYPRSENKGADQLRGYREADLRLCFRLCRLLVFPWGGSYVSWGISLEQMNGYIFPVSFVILYLLSVSFLFRIKLGSQESFGKKVSYLDSDLKL